LLEDIDDEDETECGRPLVNSEAGWRTEMAKWIGDAQAADESDSDNDSDNEIVAPAVRITKWSPCKLLVLFGGEVKRSERAGQMEFDKEAAFMEAFANQEED
jgi:hypothetical protein